MASLLEVASVARQVEVRGTKVDVYGISGEGLASLMVRFPEIGKMFSGMEVNNASVLELAPKALAAFIAAGCGNPNDERMEGIASKLGLGEQIDLIDEIMRLTFPRGIGPFVDKLQELGVLATRGLPADEASDTPSPQSSQSS